MRNGTRGWAICARQDDGTWYPLHWTVSRLRKEAIAQFDGVGDYDSEYREERAAGRMKAKRVSIIVEGMTLTTGADDA